MSNPKFSIVIPTRDRPATFRHTLATALAQPGDDYEIVVADNCGSPATRMIVDDAVTHGPRIVYLRSDEILPMGENWERGVRACSGEYVTVLGDDDGLLPSALQVARRVIAGTRVPILSWALHVYQWPDTITYWVANRLIVEFGNQLLWCNSRALLADFYGGRIEFGKLPLIYSSFVHRSIIDRARERYGGYFVPALVAPDISSGILNLCLCEKFVYSTRPLAIRGVSGKSTGAAQGARSFGGAQMDRYQQEERASLDEMIHASLIPSQNLHIVIASAKLKCRDAYFPGDPELRVDPMSLVREMLAYANVEPEDYDRNVADALALAAKIGMQVKDGEIPARQQVQTRRKWAGPLSSGQDVTRVMIDCDLARVFNVADAARLAEAAMTPFDTFGA